MFLFLIKQLHNILAFRELAKHLWYLQ